MKAALVIVAALALASAASAASAVTPPGFTEAKVLEPAASYVAGKPVQVYCARNLAAFGAAETARGGDPESAGFPDAIGGSAINLPPGVCASLLAWRNHRRVDDYGFAASALGLSHEATHLFGVSDEGATDCDALAKLPTMIRRYFPTKGHDATLSLLMLYARDAHTRKPDAYQGSC